MTSRVLDNPYEEQQTILLGRVIGNVEKLNDAMIELCTSLAEINTYNSNITALSDMWSHYQRNVEFNLRTTGTLEEPQ
ncbi:uncharacterized protein L969DRAFT_20408 [Mixia osmundae IAM 14324]|uniref:DASH complex subunit DAD4 n=1 Tax=Mixia osmundae (strain CBS 9802 / IAM 14324 / JCM 22182 / KY 12970) TaxID=764103 RepID=G7DUL7_MIXOS|nr:uncharacterized protein L969DRAFT_20408 [Mixia osmundae IAM 14324]KEI36389.1 hypothetical protein L969DRAFT_20408 [Mixia osmundae IAM 14324]GAA94277.1 hypothetical protein E5Q_00926 [Mixia osmundae IAM 14324]